MPSIKTTLFNGVMAAQQILVLLVQVRVLVEQQNNKHIADSLFTGVMAAQQILVLLVQVRILVEQQKKARLKNQAFFMC